MRMFITLISFCMVFVPMIAWGHDAPPAKAEGQTVLNLSVTQTQVFEQNLLRATAQVQHEAKDARSVQNFINSEMAKLVRSLKRFDGVLLTTGQYYVHPVYSYLTDKTQRGRGKPIVEGYKGNQTLMLEGTDTDKVLEAVALVQDAGFLVQGLQFSLSEEAARKGREDLLEAAIDKLKHQAQRVAKTLGKDKVVIDELHINTEGGGHVPPVYRTLAFDGATAEKALALPTAEPGKETLSLSVQARVLVGP